MLRHPHPPALPVRSSNAAPAPRARPARSGLAAGLLVTIWLVACASPPPVAPADTPDVPGQWRSGEDAAAPSGQTPTDLARWWQRFGDPGLEAAITQALRQGTGVRSAAAALAQARALREVADASRQPTLGASGSAQRSRSGDSAPVHRYDLGLDAGWELDLFGRLRSARDAAEADALAAETQLADVQVSLAAEVAVTWLQLRGDTTRLALVQHQLRAQEATLDLARARQRAGLASALDVVQATTGVEQTRAALAALQTGLTQTGHALAVLTGQPPGRALVVGEGPVPLPEARLVLAFPADTLRQRPDVRTAEWRLRAARARVDQATAARDPSLNLRGSLGLGASSLGALGDSAALARSLLAALSVPLLDGGAARAQVQAQAAAAEQAQVAWEAAVLQALQEVEDALAGLRGERERLARLQAAAEAAADSEQLARQRLASGLVDLRTVLDAQRSLLMAQDSLTSARTSLATAHVRLYKALGGGWQPLPAEAGATVPTAAR